MSKRENRCVALLITLVLLGSCNAVNAAVSPKNLEQLRQADLIVVGVIENVRVESERSRVERGFGNYDWGIYLTLKVERVEKGDYSQPEIEVRCFRVKSRRSAVEYLSSAGHDPIPGAGTRVRVYLNGKGAIWNVLDPNGITSHDADTDQKVWPDGSLREASEVAGVSGLMYTYLLPLEVWGMLFFVFLPTMLCVYLVVRYLRRRRATDEDEDEKESSDG